MIKKMNNFWCTNGFFPWIIMVWIGVIQLNFIFCLSLNHEGMALLKFRDGVVNDPFGALSSWNNQNGEDNPCSWFGIGCSTSNGLVISLNLTNLCLEGTLASELHHLLHIKSIVLRNNSFSGTIPEELRNLKELELLDLGYNNLYESIPLESESNITIILLDNNGLSCHISHEAELTSFVDILPYARHSDHGQDVAQRRMLLDRFNTPTKGFSKQPSSPNTKDHPGQPSTPSKTRNNSRSHDNDVVQHSFEKPSRPQPPPPPPKHIIPIDSIPSPPFIPPQISQPLSPPNPRDSTPPMPRSANVLLSSPSSKSTSSPSPSASQIKTIGIVIGAMGGFIGLVLVSLLLYLLRGNKIRKPTGLSGQLQRAFVTGDDRSDGLSSDKPSFVEGLSNLKRSELVTACEDFSNVIGTSSIGTIYKGTLSNGVEIAVISLAITSAKDWSRNLETQFRKKVEILSKVNHKNFVNLIGYCEEEQPFTRLMVFQYAPNGSLFEHLHIKEAEHLDWRTRLRVAMGLAYCLEYMHQLTPPVTHPNLNSSAVSLSEDYAAQLSDFCIWNEVAAPRLQPMTNCVSTLSTTSISLESNVYNFGLVLLEMMTGRIPQSLDNSLDEWVSEYMRGEKSLQELVDPTIHFNTKQLDKLSDIIRKCLHSEENRLTMRDVTVKMKEVTGIDQDKAAPRFSSLWWAELDVRSLNGT